MSATKEPRRVPALDLKAQFVTIRDEVCAAVQQVFDSQHFVLGPEVTALEGEIATYCRVPHAIGCASGSDALLLPLMAWDIGPGDEVITTPYTFFATASAIWRVGAKPVFVDIEPVSFNMDVEQVERAITPRTKAIIPVDLYGQVAEIDRINEVARTKQIKVLEDAAQSIGAEDDGRRAGSLCDCAALSFYPSKNLGGAGDGGMITTGDEELAQRLRRLRAHGMEPRYYHHEVGINSRLDALQAAVLRVKLRHLDQWTARRREVARRYDALFAELRLSDWVAVPTELPGKTHVFNQYVIRVPEGIRDTLRAHLAERQIGTEIYYPVPLHLQRCFAALGHKPGDFPESERAAAQTLALPVYPELNLADQEYVVTTIGEFLTHAHRHAPHAVGRPHFSERAALRDRTA